MEGMTSQEILREARAKTGFNRRQFAEHFGIPLRTVEDWEAGRRKIPDYLLRLMLYKLEIERLNQKENEMTRAEMCELTCMVMVYDDDGNVLVQDKKGGNWSGINFPGGHVEPEESFVQCAMREVKEETGLDVRNLKLCGVKQFQNKREERYIVYYFKTKDFSGEIHSSDEGEVFWVKRNQLFNYKTVEDFDKMVEVFENENLNENIYTKNKQNEWELLSI